MSFPDCFVELPNEYSVFPQRVLTRVAKLWGREMSATGFLDP